MNKRTTKTCFYVAMITLLLFVSCQKNDVTGLTLTKSTESFNIGQTDSLIAKVTGDGDITKFPVRWTSSNPGIATVSNGGILGISKGTATITAKAGNISANCVVTVNNGIYPVMTKGILDYFGDTLHTKLSNYIIVGFAGPADTLYLFINAPLTAKSNLLPGDYKLLTSIGSLTDLVPYSIIPGDLYYNAEEYSWYDGNTFRSPVNTGDLTVSVTNSVYTYGFNLIDGYGNIISGSYQGTLKFYDETSKSSAPAAKTDRLESRKLNLTSGKLKFIKGF